MKFKRLECLIKESMYYCSGCGYGIIYRLIVEVIDEDYKESKIIGVVFVGCVVFIYDYFNFDFVAAVYGRVIAAVIGVKRSILDVFVFLY